MYCNIQLLHRRNSHNLQQLVVNSITLFSGFSVVISIVFPDERLLQKKKKKSHDNKVMLNIGCCKNIRGKKLVGANLSGRYTTDKCLHT